MRPTLISYKEFNQPAVNLLKLVDKVTWLSPAGRQRSRPRAIGSVDRLLPLRRAGSMDVAY